MKTDELVTAHASGDGAPHFMELRIPRGQRLTGWVAANKQSILNSDPVLDLGESARQFQTQAPKLPQHTIDEWCEIGGRAFGVFDNR